MSVIKTRQLSKLMFYAKSLLAMLMPDALVQRKAKSLLKTFQDDPARMARVNYYNKLAEPVSLQVRKHKKWGHAETCAIKDFRFTDRSLYFCDLKLLTKYFSKDLMISYIFEDLSKTPEFCAFVKSRPISEENQNSILLKLDSFRHFNFVSDQLRFQDKKNVAIWRGACYSRQNRQRLVEKFMGHPRVDAKDTNRKMKWTSGYGDFMSISDQLHYKFIVSLEGADVASNTKWIMSSNSLCLMPRPTVETWFMEGKLMPDHHYVLIRDDYADVEEKMDYYVRNPKEALAITQNAHEYVRQFKDKEEELIVSFLVMDKFFKLTGQSQ